REVREEVGLEVQIEHRLGDRIQPVSKRHMHYFICRVVGGEVDLVDHEENTEGAWCTLDEVHQDFEELAQIPGGMYPRLFEYLERVLVKALGLNGSPDPTLPAARTGRPLDKACTRGAISPGPTVRSGFCSIRGG